MDLLMTILLLLLILLISNVVSHYTPFIPTALIQVALGVLAAFLFDDISLDIETEWFLLLFIAPLLYNDGRNFPREELWRMRWPILGNAVILVLITTVAGGYFIHWLIDDIPLAAAFALAAILSPTDPVAVNGIAKRIHLPQKVLNLVRGESLINDASGLVAFNYAVAAVVTGYFSWQEAALDFSFKFVAGGILGLVLGLLVIGIRFALRRQGISDVSFQALLSVLTPFLIFIITEELLHASGVIAVVVAGIIHSLVRERTETLVAEEQVLTENIWTIILFILNGIVFLLLGLSIPSSISGVLENRSINEWVLFSFVLAIGLVILGIRFVWAYLFSAYEYHSGHMASEEKPDLRTALMVSLTGVRGTVTMVGILSLPYLLANGDAFPNRSLLLFLAAGTILFTLILATVLLPILSKGEMPEAGTGKFTTEDARRKILLKSISTLKQKMSEENEVAAYELIDEYTVRLQQIEPDTQQLKKGTKTLQDKLREIRLIALDEERAYLNRVNESPGMTQEVYEAFEKSLDRREEAVSRSIRSMMVYMQGKLIRAYKRMRGQYIKDEETRLVQLEEAQEIQIGALKVALEKLEEVAADKERKDYVQAVITDYKQMISGAQRPELHFNEEFELQKEELRLIVMDKGRSEIYKMYEAGDISREQAKELRRYVNHIESVTLYEREE
ncbi:Na+/H+ antiporter [Planococcus sp. FY231025]|uniref:Na+/H+ antiporter n=1 Tax=Planococcus sp. FY231025 TaxID=3455699 RepID=UPI003F8FCC64